MTVATQVENTPTETVTQGPVAVAAGLTPITAENVPEESVGLGCELTSGLEHMTAAAQAGSALSEAGSQCFDGTVGGLFPITAEIVHAENVGLSCEVTSGPEPMIADAQVENVFREIVTQNYVAVAVSLTHITAENMPEETVGLNYGDTKHPKGRNRRADQNRRKSQDRRNRKRKKQLSAGTEATHEAVGSKTRDADVSSIEFAHEPDPLYPTVDGDAKE
jgi:hypothetical protein